MRGSTRLSSRSPLFSRWRSRFQRCCATGAFDRMPSLATASARSRQPSSRAPSLPTRPRVSVGLRSRIMQKATGSGKMLLVEGLNEEALEALSARRGLGVAALNGPDQIVLAGDEGELATLLSSEGLREAERLRFPCPWRMRFTALRWSRSRVSFVGRRAQ